MMGMAARGHSIRVAGTAIEVAVRSAHGLLGGTVGVGTLIYAFAIGPLVHLLLAPLEVGKREAPAPVSPGPQGS
jgi:uncharacterized membrane protein YczE